MKKFLVWLLILTGMPVFADEVSLEKVEAQKIQLPKTNIKTKQSLVVNDEQVIQELISRQKEKDVEDIENLWKGTVENNQVIGFALKKLATPESQRRIHSSLMAKTLSAGGERARKKAQKKVMMRQEYNVLKSHLSDFFNAKVQFTCDEKGKGKISIPFKNEEDLERIIGLFDKLK